MNAMELIRHRRSVRTFNGEALRDDDAKRILEYAWNVQNPFGLPITWKLLHAKEQGLSVPVIVGADTYIAGKMKRQPFAEEAFGYAFERVVLYAEDKGIGTTWIAGTMDRHAFEREMDLEEDEVMPCISPLGYPAEKMSLRETMMRKGVRAETRLDFSELFFDGSFARRLTKEKAGDISSALEMVRWAPSAVNKQPWRIVVTEHAAHFYEQQSRGYVDEHGWDVQKLDIGIALCHFDIGMEAEGRKTRLEICDPGMDVPEGTRYIASVFME